MSSSEAQDELRLAADPATSTTMLGQLAGKSLELARLVARNPSATPRLLRCIAMSWQEARADVARHPELQRTLAGELGMEHPAALCENPSIPPRIASRRSLPRKTVAHLLAQHPPPRWLLPALVAHPQPSMRALAAGYAETDAAVVAQLSRDEDRAVRAAAAGHAALPVAELMRLAADPSEEVRGAVAERKDLPVEVQRALARGGHQWGVSWRLAKVATDEETLAALASYADWFIGRDVAANPATPPRALELLAAHDSADVRLQVARNPRTPEAVLLRLLESRDDKHRELSSFVQRAVLQNPSLSVAHFARLVSSPIPEMRISLAECTRTPVAILRGLAVGDPDDRVRAAAAANDACVLGDEAGAKLGRALARDASAHVRKAVAARSPDVALLATLAADPAGQVRAAFAGSAHAAPTLLAQLASDPDLGVRKAVARHLSTPPATLRAMMKDVYEDVWSLAMESSSLPVFSMLEALDALPRHSSRSFPAVRRLNQLPPDDPQWEQAYRLDRPLVEELLAMSKALPLSLAERMTYSRRAESRILLAVHSPCAEVLLRLTHDADPRVRLAVARRLEHRRWESRPEAFVDALAAIAHHLAGDSSDEVRGQVATWSRGSAVLTALASDPVRSVRLCALRNSHSPPPVLLAALRGDVDEEHAATSALTRRGHPRLGRTLGKAKG